MTALDLDVTSIPTMTNGGMVLLLLLLMVGLGLWLLRRPPVFRCTSCGAEFGTFAELTDHEDAAGVHTVHASRPGCGCGDGAYHHPSCSRRGQRGRRAA